jgi:excisionase family DNA binding protein
VPELSFTEAELDRLADVLAERVAARLAPRDRSGPELLTVSDAAKILGCHPKTVRRRIADRSLPAVVEHGRVMLRADELHRYVEGLERAGSFPSPRRRRRRSRDLGLDFLHE